MSVVAAEEDAGSIGYDTESLSSQQLLYESRKIHPPSPLSLSSRRMKHSRSFGDEEWARISGSVNPLSQSQSHHHSGSYRLGELAPYVLDKLAKGEAELKLSPEGEGGTYFVVPTAAKRRPSSGSATKTTPLPSSPYPLAVWKPSIEEIGMPGNPRGNCVMDRTGFTPGEGYKREALAWRLDHDHFANIPETVIVQIDGKVGSLQRFIPARPSYDFGPRRFDVSAVHRIGIFDIRTLNGDRHDGNMLVPVADGSMLIPIDHSYILPRGFADPDQLDWMGWQQSKVPFSPSEIRYIAALDAHADRQLVSEELGEEAGDVIYVATRVLQVAASRGYTLAEIASFCRRETISLPSQLELVMAECRSVDIDTLDTALDMESIEVRLDVSFPLRSSRS